MQAWQVSAHGEPLVALRRADIAEPVPGSGEVRIRVDAAAVGLPDALLCRGSYPFDPPLPFVPGQEVCGVVEDVGDGVDLAVGARVMGVTCFYDGRGGFAESSVLAAANAFRVPDGMPSVEAAAFRIGFSTAWTALVRRGGLEVGETLVVLGAAGGSGQAAVQLGAALGARVIAVASGSEKVEACRRMGAAVAIDRCSTAVPEAILEATDRAGADVIFDPVGGDLASSLLPALGRGGRFLAVGFASGDWVRLDTAALVGRNQSLVGVLASGASRLEEEADHEALLALAAGGSLRGLTTTVPFAEVPSAVAAVETGEVIGKLVMESWS